MIECVAACAAGSMSRLSCQSMANTRWAPANFQVMGKVVVDAVQYRACNMPIALETTCWSRSELIAFAQGLLGIAWAHAFLEIELDGLGGILKRSLLMIGLEVDRR